MSNRPVSPLATAATSTYAPKNVEHMFDHFTGSETGHGKQISAESTPHLLMAQSSQRAGSPATREELLAVKTAQMVADHIADSAYKAMTRLGDEFSPASFIVEAGRAAAGLLAPALQPLTAAQRAAVVDRAVDPTSCDESLDLILDGIGQMLRTYARYLKRPGWTCLQDIGCDYLDGRVIAWVKDGYVVLDLLHTDVPDPDDEAQADELRDVFAYMLNLSDAFGVEFYPTRTPSLARLYTWHDEWWPMGGKHGCGFDCTSDAA